MNISAHINSQYRSGPILGLTRSKGHFNGHEIHVNLSEYLPEYDDKYGPVDNRLIRAIHDDEAPEWTNMSAFMFLKRTIEGQEFLEYVFGESLHIDIKMELPGDVKFIDDFDDTLPESTYEREKPNINVRREVFSKIDGSAPEYIYTIILTDKYSNEFYYVGKTRNPISRLKNHISMGGDFAEAKRRDKTYVVSIESIKPISNISEREQYQKISKNVNSEVYGGR